VKLQIKTAPEKAGIYIFLDENKNTLYVGKSVNIKKRLHSYLLSGNRNGKSSLLMKLATNLDFIVTETETEALILENNYIKTHRPQFNIQLKDDKNYPYIRITTSEEFPRIRLVRKRTKKEDTYFGPYTDVKAVRSFIKQIITIFPIASCKRKVIAQKRKRPCLLYQLNRCLAPCSFKIDEKEYQKNVIQVIKLIQGRSRTLLGELKQEMEVASKKLNFEKAAECRDKLDAIKKITQKQRIESKNIDAEYDILGIKTTDNLGVIQILKMREGRISGQEHFSISIPINSEIEDSLRAFILQYYSKVNLIPKKIIIEKTFKDTEIVNKWLNEIIQNSNQEMKTKLTQPESQEHRKLIEIANENAQYYLESKKEIKEAKKVQLIRVLKKLKKQLSLPTIPFRIEGYDVSTLQGSHTVSSRVVFSKGTPLKSAYRKFRIKTFEGENDVRALQETINRRFAGSLKDEPKPDLLLIDGGLPQINGVVKVLKMLKLEIPILGLAKKNEEIFSPKEKQPIVLEKNSEELKMLQRIRDEAHRFAKKYHITTRKKKMIQLSLENIEGLGEKRIKRLLNHFGSISKIRKAEIDDLIEVPGISTKIAKKIIQYYSRNLE
jgi:excinuclease ABC subunit C